MAKKIVRRKAPALKDAAAPQLSSRQLSEAVFAAIPELQEVLTQADFELAREDIGWTGLGQTRGTELLPHTRKLLIEKSRLAWRTDPLAKQAVRIWTTYCLGNGLSYEAEDSTVNDEIDAFFTSPINETLLNPAGQQYLSNKLLVDGDIFFTVFPSTEPVASLRYIDPIQIDDIITDPDDELRITCYRRKTSKNETFYYADWALDEEAISEVDGSKDTDQDGEIKLFRDKQGEIVPVYHLAFDRFGKWGNGLLVPSLIWSREHERFMISRVAIAQALAKFASKLTVKGGQAAVDAAQKRFQSSMVQTGLTGSGFERNPSPAPGGTFLQNAGIDLQATPRSTGASDATGDSNNLIRMICAATGVFFHYLTGDPSTGNLATACYSEDTEYLSDQGWKHYTAFSDDKIATYDPATGSIHYEVPRAFHVYPYRGLLTHFQGRGTDCLVTPNHRMWTRLTPHNVGHAGYENWKQTEPFKFLCADGLSNQTQRFSFVNRSTIQNIDGPEYTVIGGHQWSSMAAARFLGLFLSEGSIYVQKSRNCVIEFGQRVESTFTAEIDALLLDLFAKTGRKPDSLGMAHWTLSDFTLHDWLRDNCGKGAGAKHFPEIVWTLSLAAKTELFNWMMKGDGHHHRNAKSLNCTSGFYSTSSVTLLNDFQRLCCEIGVSCHTRMARQKPGCLPEYIAQLRFDCASTELDPDSNCSELPYEGDVWCFETSTGIFVTRRNGKISYQGNTSMELPMMKEFLSYQELWRGAYRRILAIARKEDPSKKPEPITIEMPPILDEDLTKLGTFLGPLTTAFPETKIPEVLRPFLIALGVEDIDDVMDAIDKQREKIDAQNLKDQQQAHANAMALATAKTAPAPAPTAAAPPQVSMNKESIDALNHFANSLSEIIS